MVRIIGGPAGLFLHQVLECVLTHRVSVIEFLKPEIDRLRFASEQVSSKPIQKLLSPGCHEREPDPLFHVSSLPLNCHFQTDCFCARGGVYHCLRALPSRSICPVLRCDCDRSNVIHLRALRCTVLSTPENGKFLQHHLSGVFAGSYCVLEFQSSGLNVVLHPSILHFQCHLCHHYALEIIKELLTNS